MTDSNGKKVYVNGNVSDLQAGEMAVLTFRSIQLTNGEGQSSSGFYVILSSLSARLSTLLLRSGIPLPVATSPQSR